MNRNIIMFRTYRFIVWKSWLTLEQNIQIINGFEGVTNVQITCTATFSQICTPGQKVNYFVHNSFFYRLYQIQISYIRYQIPGLNWELKSDIKKPSGLIMQFPLKKISSGKKTYWLRFSRGSNMNLKFSNDRIFIYW